jgi:hypothetical protein
MGAYIREGLRSAGFLALILTGALFFSCDQAAGPISKSEDTPARGNETETPEPVKYRAAANGGNGEQDSTVILFDFDEDLADLHAADISLVNGGGAAYKGALTGNGKEWSLGVAVQQAGTVTVRVNREGIEKGEKPVALYRAAETIRIGYTAAADGSNDKASSVIHLYFGAALTELFAADIAITDSTGSAYPMELFGGGQEWTLGIAAIKTGNVRVSINREDVEAGERIVAVYALEEDYPPEPERIGITVISPPEITLYARNQTFDPTGLEIAWAYNDGSVEAMAPGEYQLGEPDMAKPVAQRVNVQAGGYKTSFWIQVLNSDKALVSISADGPANKIQDFGREFDRTGLVVTGHFSDGSTSNLASYAALVGYDKLRRGPQDISVKVNGKTAALEGILTRIGESALVSILRDWSGMVNSQAVNYKDVYIKGETITPRSNIHLLVSPSGDWNVSKLILSLDSGGLLEEDFATLTGYNPGQTGWQNPSMTVDGRIIGLHVRVIDVKPAVWFDYGYMRHEGDPTGHGPGAGAYYAKPGETLVIAPVRYLLGYNPDHSDAGASYFWTVSGDDSSRTWTTTGNGGEMLHITPKTAGTCTITVDVTGRDYVTGNSITTTAATELICYAASLPAGTFDSPLRNFAPGQFTSGGNGFGWSLGAAGGYEVWTVDHQPSYYIRGNPMVNWLEPGVVWLQEDNNGNGLPDEMWHELRGGDDDDPAWKDYVTRRYALTWFTGDGTPTQLNQPVPNTSGKAVCWIDNRGRTGIMPGDFSSKWGVTGNWVTYTGTLVRDNGNIATGTYSGLSEMYGYVDAMNSTFPVDRAMSADGAFVNLSAVKFIKVQTGVFRYGGIFGEVSTEIKYADGLGQQSDFPDP